MRDYDRELCLERAAAHARAASRWAASIEAFGESMLLSRLAESLSSMRVDYAHRAGGIPLHLPSAARPASKREALRLVEPAPSYAPLTEREAQVSALVARGLTNGQIADELVLTKGTVANHVEHILNKLGFSCRAQIAVWAVERRLLDSSTLAGAPRDRGPIPLDPTARISAAS